MTDMLRIPLRARARAPRLAGRIGSFTPAPLAAADAISPCCAAHAAAVACADVPHVATSGGKTAAAEVLAAAPGAQSEHAHTPPPRQALPLAATAASPLPREAAIVGASAPGGATEKENVRPAQREGAGNVTDVRAAATPRSARKRRPHVPDSDVARKLAPRVADAVTPVTPVTPITPVTPFHALRQEPATAASVQAAAERARDAPVSTPAHTSILSAFTPSPYSVASALRGGTSSSRVRGSGAALDDRRTGAPDATVAPHWDAEFSPVPELAGRKQAARAGSAASWSKHGAALPSEHEGDEIVADV